jgi:predicted O-methyltransferase YrrM
VESSFPHYQEAVQQVSTLAHATGQRTSTIYYGLALDLPWERLINNPIDLLFVDARKSEY